MTQKFDEKASDIFTRQSDMFGLLNTDTNQRVADMVIKQVSVSSIRGIVAANHYSHIMPDSTVIAFAGLFGNVICGVVVFGVGTSPAQYKNILPGIQDGEYLELTRLWCSDESPRNTESKLVSGAMKMLHAKYKLIVSYADPSRGHVGYIYQACNFYYCGMTQGGTRLVDEKGKERHQKSVNIYKIRRPEFKDLSYREIMERMGWRHIENAKKHRYVFLRGGRLEKKQSLKVIKPLVMQYPKLINP